MGTDLLPALAVRIPAKDLEPIPLVERAEPGERFPVVNQGQGVAMSVLADRHAAPTLIVECLDAALDEIEYNRSTRGAGPAPR